MEIILVSVLGNYKHVRRSSTSAVSFFRDFSAPLSVSHVSVPHISRSLDVKFIHVGDSREDSGRGHTKETGILNATAISEKCRRFQAGN
jgi:hypothetical protein